MNILFYVPSISKASGGIYQYAIALLKILAKDEQNIYYVFNFTDDLNLKEIAQSSKQVFLIPKKECIDKSFFYKTNRIKQKINKVIKKTGIPIKLPVSFALDQAIKRYRIDILHCPDEWLPETTSTPSISTIHDLQELYFPEYFTSQQRIDRAIRKKNAIDNVQAVLCSYAHVKTDIIKFFGTSPDNIHVCLLNMDNLWFTKFDKKDAIIHKDIPEEFILYPAVTWQHKNHANLIRALSFLQTSYKLKINLIVTGHKSEYYYQELVPLIKSLGLEDQIFFLGIVEDKILYSLYQKTLGVVVPTLYEAGSFPLMESMMMGIPVICSDVTSLPETIGNEKFIFNPKDIEDIAEKVKLLMFDEKFRKENLSNSSMQNKNLQNNQAIRIIHRAYTSIKSKSQK